MIIIWAVITMMRIFALLIFITVRIILAITRHAHRTAVRARYRRALRARR